MPVSFVKLSAVSRCRSSIWGLLTIRTLMLSGSPAELPPPAPTQAEALSATHRAPAANEATRIFARIKDSFVLQGVRCCPFRLLRRGAGPETGDGLEAGCLAAVPQG